MTFPTHGAPTATADAAGTTSHTINLPAFSTGDRIIVISYNRDPGSYTLPAAWTQLESLNDPATSTHRFIAYYRDMQAGDASTVVGTSAVSAKAASTATKFTAGTFDSGVGPYHASTNGTSATPDPPNLAPGVGALDFTWVAAFGENQQNTTISVYPLTGNNTRVPTTGGAGTTGGIQGYCDQDINAASQNPGTFTSSFNSKWTVVTLAVAPVTAAAAASLIYPAGMPPTLLVR